MSEQTTVDGSVSPSTGPAGATDSTAQTRAVETEEASTETEARLPLDQTFEILKNQRRRYVLRYLDSTDGQVSLSELAERIAAWENDKEVRRISSSERKRVYVGLYQCHLPKMDDMDVIEFNKPRGTIRNGENADQVKQYLEPDDSAGESSWDRRYVGVAVFGLTLLPVAILLQSTALPAVVAAVAVSLVLSLGAVYHLT